MKNQSWFQIFQIAVYYTWKRIIFYSQSLISQTMQVNLKTQISVCHQVCDSEFRKFTFRIQSFLNIFSKFFSGKLGILFTLRADDDYFTRFEDHDGTFRLRLPNDEGRKPFLIESGVFNFFGKILEIYVLFKRHFAIWDYILDDGSLTWHTVEGKK